MRNSGKSGENAKSQEPSLSASCANPWVAVFGDKSYSSPRGTLFVTILDTFSKAVDGVVDKGGQFVGTEAGGGAAQPLGCQRVSRAELAAPKRRDCPRPSACPEKVSNTLFGEFRKCLQG